jgi:hypothetical protein
MQRISTTTALFLGEGRWNENYACTAIPATTAPTSIIGAIVLPATFPEAVVLVAEVPGTVAPVVEPVVVFVVAAVAVAVAAVPVGKGPISATVKVAETISRISVPGRTYVLS